MSVGSGKCVAPSGGSSASNTNLVQLPCSASNGRVWRLPAFTGGGSGPATFTNPLSQRGPDPWLTYHDGYYYLATTTWNSTVTMRESPTLGGLATAPEQVIFNLTRPNGAGTMWAPEFQLLDGPGGKRWYFYYTAGREPFDLGTQRIHVLESAGLDPMGPYSFKADLLDPTQDNTWELDPGILQLNGRLYLLGTFYNGGDPLDSVSWVKSPNPVFQRSDANGVYGPGHNGFFKSPDGTEDWIVYNANSSASGGCDMHRSTRAQKFTWNADGTPNFGTPVGLGVPLISPWGEQADQADQAG
ncbi:family 43 glycosylhydrolase [Streptomyces viridochromogenes]|uniref:family 43 glycosylhydrolase n=1 Tax=Streptomyces viridochromogenes TaxID=1938 RepID=UPI000AC8C744|nr:family 43 glycosylhydrolase [Streptomyces viridochromogenes]